MGNEFERNEFCIKLKCYLIYENGFTINEFGDYGTTHIYPKPIYLIQYLSRMHTIFLKIRNCTNCSKMQIIEMLSDYYHTGINAHLFKRVNQSILMSQINYVILRIGLSGITHLSGPPLSIKLDYAAITLNPEEFKNFFIREVIEQNIE